MARLRRAVVVMLAIGSAALAGSVDPSVAAQASSTQPVNIDSMVSALNDAASQTLRRGSEQTAVSIADQQPGDGWTSPIEGSSGVTDGVIETALETNATSADGAVVVIKAKLKGSVCPDPRGRVPVEVTVDASERYPGEPISNERRTIGFTGQVDDDARLVSSDVQVQDSTSVSGEGEVTAWEGTSALTGRRGTLRRSPSRVDVHGRRTFNVRAGARQSTDDAAELARAVLRRAEQLWRNGYCVELRVLDGQSRKVKAHEQVGIVVSPFQKFENAELHDRVDARLAAGTRTVTPSRRPRSPAHFTYTAGKRREHGTVALKSTSRRGIGNVELSYEVAGDLKATGDAYGGSYVGVKCEGPEGEWKIEGNAPGDPRRESHVTITLDASGAGTAMITDEVFIEGNPAPDTTETESPARYDEDAGTLTFGAVNDYVLHVEEGSFCP